MKSTATKPVPPRIALSTISLPLAFMSFGMVFFLIGLLILPWKAALLAITFYHPDVLTMTHLWTLGWISATIIGASFQIVPVMTGTTLWSKSLGWWCLLLYACGLLLLLSGLTDPREDVLITGGLCLFSAAALYGINIYKTIFSAPHRTVIHWHVLAAAAQFVLVATMGALLAINKTRGFLPGGVLNGLAAHITLALGGWVVGMVVGAAYKLIGMFTMTDDRFNPKLAWAGLFCLHGGVWVVALSLLLGAGTTLPGALAIVAGLILFVAQLFTMYRARRRHFDIHMPFTWVAAGIGAVVSVLFIAGIVFGASPSFWMIVVWLTLVGFAGTLVQGYLYKITTFLVWLSIYAPQVGKRPIPALDDLYSQGIALGALVLWGIGVTAVAVGIAAGQSSLMPLLSLPLVAGGLLWVANIGAIWIPRPASPRNAPVRPSSQQL